MAGFVPVLPAGIYVTVALLFIILFQSKSVTMSFAFPLVALPLIVACFHSPRVAYIYVAWMALALLYDWRRFFLALLYDWRRFFGVVREFIENIKKLYQRFSTD